MRSSLTLIVVGSLFSAVCLSQLVLLSPLLNDKSDTFTILQAVVPERFKSADFMSNDILIQVDKPKRLYANRYRTVEELSDALFGDVKYIQNFNLSATVNFNFEDYEVSQNAEVNILTEQLIGGLVTKLYKIYKEFSLIWVIIHDMTADDYIALYDLIYDAQDLVHDAESLSVEAFEQGLDSWDFLDSFEWEGIRPEFNYTAQKSFVPFLDDDYDALKEDQVDAQLLLLLLKLPLIILKLIAKLFWNLIALKKLLEILENKICLIIIAILQKICSLIILIKKEIIFKVKVILYAIKSGLVFKKILTILFLILKKLKVLSWILKDLLYRYKWKLIFLIKKAQKTSLLIAVYFQELVYKKLGIETQEQKRYIDFVNYDDDYYDWDDYDYFEEFAHYVYKKPGTYKSQDSEFDKLIRDNIEAIWETNGGNDGPNIDGDDDWDLQFELKEEYGFDTVRLNLQKFQEKLKEEESKYHKQEREKEFEDVEFETP